MGMTQVFVLLFCWMMAMGMFGLAIYTPFYLMEYQMLFAGTGVALLVLSVLVIWKLRW